MLDQYRVIRNIITSLILFGCLVNVVKAEEPSEKLVVVSPFPHFITQEYRSAFKRQYPQVELEIIKMGSSEAIKYLMKQSNKHIADIFWASSPDSFNRLKRLDALQPYKATMRGVPKVISGVQLSDSDNYFTGYALSGYGFMWNVRYLKIKELPVPNNWESLSDSKYFDHIGMASPAVSSTTHIAVESILQTRGWEKGWRLVKSIAANTKKLSKRSFHVPQKVEQGEYGIGVVIDYYALSSKAQHHPVDFSYSSPAVLLPASVAMLKGAPNPNAARKFIDFLVSPNGQSMLLDDKIRRIPILRDTFEEAPDDYPNPYKSNKLAETFNFDVVLSTKRYGLIDALFDAIISNNFAALKEATSRIHALESSLKNRNNKEADLLLVQAKEKLLWLPNVTDSQSQDENFLSKTTAQKKIWSTAANQSYRDAIKLVKQASMIIKESSD